MRNWKDNFRASGIHLGLSLLVAALAAVVVFGLWYPSPYHEFSGGRELFTLLVSVDIVMGPLITLMVYSKTKPWKVMRRDFAVIGLLQLAALGYGMWTVFLARPVYLSFEYTRFRVVHAIDVRTDLLDKALPEFRSLPLTGPRIIGLREPIDIKEKNDTAFEAMAGQSTTARPDFWQPYEKSIPEILKAAKPVSELLQRLPDSGAVLQPILQSSGKAPSQLVYLPCNARQHFWTVLLDAQTAQFIALAPVDSF
ncbi:MAG: hypothetical protein RLZZ271_136 [Pseudomonadota bacterium]|jgi:hypothetical protein